jgi:hypothetical protein
VGTGEVIIDSSIWVATTTGLARRLDDLLLARRHGFERQLHAEIAARDHHRIGEGENLVERLKRGGLLDLGENARATGGHLPQLRDVVGTLHEGQPEPVDRQRQRVIEIGTILGRERRYGQHRVGEVDALVVLDDATLHDVGGHTVLLHLDRHEPHLPVVDQERAARFERGENLRMRDGHRIAVGGLAAHKGHARAGLKLPLAAELAEAELGALKVDKDRDRPPDVVLHAAHRLDQGLQVRVAGVAHIDAEDVDAREEQRAQLFGRPAGGAERRDDLGHAASAHRS